jgi:hypothetical protein
MEREREMGGVFPWFADENLMVMLIGFPKLNDFSYEKL